MKSDFAALSSTEIRPEHRALIVGRNDSKMLRPPSEVRAAFVAFAKERKRSLPWRAPEVVPFHLLVAELLLVQTKAIDVARVWPLLIARHPSPHSLSTARVTSLANLLRPLGLQNQRARALRSVSLHLIEEHDGQVPSNAQDLLSIPHVGLYVATAVGSFAFGYRVPIVDANVMRVLARIFAFPAPRELRRRYEIWAAAWALLPRRHRDAAIHNYGILDFGAEVCTPRLPRCHACPIRRSCAYGSDPIATGL